MSDTRSSFLTDIVEYRNDLSYRLIYADWLEEYGAEDDLKRAKFIRAQCNLYKNGYNAEDQTTQVELLKENRLKWFQEDTGPYCSELWMYPVYKRGFIETTSCRLFVAITPHYLDMLPLSGMTIRGDVGLMTDDRIEYIYAMTHHKYWKEIKDIDIRIWGLSLSDISYLISGKKSKVKLTFPTITSKSHLETIMTVARGSGISHLGLSSCGRDHWRGRGIYYDSIALQDTVLEAGLGWLSGTWNPGD